MGDAFSVRDVQGSDEHEDRATALPMAVGREATWQMANGLGSAWMLGMAVVGCTTGGSRAWPLGEGYCDRNRPGDAFL